MVGHYPKILAAFGLAFIRMPFPCCVRFDRRTGIAPRDQAGRGAPDAEPRVYETGTRAERVVGGFPRSCRIRGGSDVENFRGEFFPLQPSASQVTECMIARRTGRLVLRRTPKWHV